MAKKKNGDADKKPVIGLIEGGVLRSLMKSVIIEQNRASTASGNMGDLIQKAAEKKNLHKGAFSDAKKLFRMGKKDPAKLWLHLAHFDHMRKELGLDDMAGEQPDMVGSGVEEETDSKPDDGKVRQLRPAREVETQAGATA